MKKRNGNAKLFHRVRSMRPGSKFYVDTNSERIQASQIGKTLKMAGVIDFDIFTRKQDDGKYVVAAIIT